MKSTSLTLNACLLASLRSGPARQAKRLRLKAVVILSLFLLITYHLLVLSSSSSSNLRFSESNDLRLSESNDEVEGSLFTNSAHAQNLPTLGGVAVNVEINDSDVRQGDIISITKDGFKRSTVEYDVLIFGVVTNAPILSVEPRTDTTRSVLSSGETLVRVSGANGEIAEGDLITTSVQPGLGQKATRSGYVIGKALQGYSDSGEGLISVLVGPSFGPAGGGAGAGAGALIGIATDPANSRYVLAAILGIVVAIGGTIAFIRLISTGVTAVGRNPLAKGSIYRSMFVAAAVIAVLAIAGVVAVVAIIAN